MALRVMKALDSYNTADTQENVQAEAKGPVIQSSVEVVTVDGCRFLSIMMPLDVKAEMVRSYDDPVKDPKTGVESYIAKGVACYKADIPEGLELQVLLPQGTVMRYPVKRGGILASRWINQMFNPLKGYRLVSAENQAIEAAASE